jgi:hypothetical protein
MLARLRIRAAAFEDWPDSLEIGCERFQEFARISRRHAILGVTREDVKSINGVLAGRQEAKTLLELLKQLRETRIDWSADEDGADVIVDKRSEPSSNTRTLSDVSGAEPFSTLQREGVEKNFELASEYDRDVFFTRWIRPLAETATEISIFDTNGATRSGCQAIAWLVASIMGTPAPAQGRRVCIYISPPKKRLGQADVYDTCDVACQELTRLIARRVKSLGASWDECELVFLATPRKVDRPSSCTKVSLHNRHIRFRHGNSADALQSAIGIKEGLDCLVPDGKGRWNSPIEPTYGVGAEICRAYIERECVVREKGVAVSIGPSS